MIMPERDLDLTGVFAPPGVDLARASDGSVSQAVAVKFWVLDQSAKKRR